MSEPERRGLADVRGEAGESGEELTPPRRDDATGPVAVIDVGSNSVRLVVYDRHNRVPAPMFNERVLCGLARGMRSTGRLDREGRALARQTLHRFAKLVRGMRVAQLKVVATAAVRDARDGAEFVDEIREACGLDIHILSGSEEAVYTAEGVLAGIPDAEGVVADLGGGSLELVSVGHGTLGDRATLPIGPLRLMDDGAPLAPAEIRTIVDDALSGHDWIARNEGRTLYAVGGAWRAFARSHMIRTGYPLRMMQQYRMPSDVARDVALNVSGLGDGKGGAAAAVQPRDEESRRAYIKEADAHRRDTLPLACFILSRLIQAMEPRDVTFSVLGLREGLFHAELPPDVKARDPLIEECRFLCHERGRFARAAEELMAWMSAIFPDESPAQRRIRLAACYLSDTGWRAHADYRAEKNFRDTLYAPFLGVDHAGRAMMAIAVYARYSNDLDNALVHTSRAVLGDAEFQYARSVGHALRLGHMITGGVPGLLEGCNLVLDGETVTLNLPPAHADLNGEAVKRRLQNLARSLGRHAVIHLAA